MTITVTLMDISKAEEARNNLDDTQACPIYQALKRKLGDKLIGVSRRYIWTKDGKDYLLPKEAVDFTIDFDKKKEVKPFKFEVK